MLKPTLPNKINSKKSNERVYAPCSNRDLESLDEVRKPNTNPHKKTHSRYSSYSFRPSLIFPKPLPIFLLRKSSPIIICSILHLKSPTHAPTKLIPNTSKTQTQTTPANTTETYSHPSTSHKSQPKPLIKLRNPQRIQQRLLVNRDLKLNPRTPPAAILACLLHIRSSINLKRC